MSEELDHPQELEDLLNECILAKAFTDVQIKHPLMSLYQARTHLCRFCNPKNPDELICCADISERIKTTREKFKTLNCLYHAKQAKDLGDRYEKKYKVKKENDVVPIHEKNKTWGKIITPDPDFKPEPLKDDYQGHPAEHVAPLPQKFFNEKTGLFEHRRPNYDVTPRISSEQARDPETDLI